ncbi:DUF2637 domain-containing protein [Micromonospora sp. NBC_01813]|uniref:DUF2637 domain-containing protein n=1 Tax=Micromonospora sp. NBC_01813 TaxID=2975988 RepID=UPI002DD949B8|nr:DUF2637 domain-containing protein [Micromonospora sp. NBC_01813]WSA11523.1 DUF2637 domain-containing protein [Micromonospora sp. NBC_01813]
MGDRTLWGSRAALSGIAAIAAGVSYWTQRGLLLDHDVDPVSATAIPLTVDLAVIASSLVINSPEIDPQARRLAWAVLGVACAVSIGANAVAGDNLVQRIAHVWCVLIYLGTEAVASLARRHRSAEQAKPARTPRAAKAVQPADQDTASPATKPRRPRSRTRVTPISEIEAGKTANQPSITQVAKEAIA